MRNVPLPAAVFAVSLAAAPVLAQDAGAPIDLRAGFGGGPAPIVPGESIDTSTDPAAPANVIDLVAPDDAIVTTNPDPLTGSIVREAPVNRRVAPEPMVDTSDPPGFIAGNSLRRTIEENPYAPLGIRTGSFIMFPSITFSGGYTSNSTDAPGGDGAWLGIVAPEILLESDWSRHEARVLLRGSYEAYSDGTEPLPDVQAEATLRLDHADRWATEFAAAYDYTQESLGDPNLASGIDQAPDYYKASGSVTLSGAFGRALFEVEGGAETTVYDDAKSGGRTVSQRDRDNTLYGGRLRLGYEATRTFVPFVEGILTERHYAQKRDDSGIKRSSHGGGLRGGFAFDRSPVSSGEIAIGYLTEEFDDNSLKPLTAMTVDGNLAWAPTRLTTINTTLVSSLNPTTDRDSSGSVVYEGLIDLAYAWRQNVIFGANAGAAYEGFQGTHQIDWTYRLGIGVAWQPNRYTEIAAGYTHEWRDSSVRRNDYATDTVRVDLTLRR